jgi:hypothetical protein
MQIPLRHFAFAEREPNKAFDAPHTGKNKRVASTGRTSWDQDLKADRA